MKIVFFVRLFYPHIGGVERHVWEVGRRLVVGGHRVTVVTERSDEALPLEETVDGIQICRIRVGGEDWGKKFRVWSEIWKLRKIVRHSDIVHCHDVFFWYLPLRFVYPYKNVFTTFHGYETVFPPQKSAIFIRKISEKLSRGNICVGDFIKKWYGTRPTFVTYGGIQNTKKSTFKTLNTSKINIAFIGRLDADTGLLFYMQALQLLKEKNIQFSFDLYGDGELKKIAQKTGTVHGFVKDVEKEIAQADIVFASSYLSILESMAELKQIYSTYSNPLKEDYLKMTPFSKFIVIENDPKKLAEKIEYYFKHPKEQKKMVDSAYDWVKDQTWDTITTLYVKLWKR